MARINWDLFEHWSTKKAWFLGLMLGDGNVYQKYGNNRVSIVCNLDTVSKWQTLVSPDSEIQQRTPNAWEAYLYSKELTDWFATIGIVGEKATNLKFPDWVPEQYMSHFIRGLIDTDGSIRIEKRRKKNGNNTLNLSFSAKNKDFCTAVRDKNLQYVSVDPVVIINNKKKINNVIHTWHSFKFSGAPAMKICEWLYQDSEDAIRGLSRYETYINYVNWQKSFVCPCGQQAWSDYLCQTCWWKKRAEDNPKAPCKCGKPVMAKGMCSACYTVERRKTPAGARKSNGMCLCGSQAYRRGMCDKCYSREYRSNKAGMTPG